jgi:hypothetical protein
MGEQDASDVLMKSAESASSGLASGGARKSTASPDARRRGASQSDRVTAGERRYDQPAADISVNMQDVKALAGIRHLKLPVIHLAQPCDWYRGQLGLRGHEGVRRAGQAYGLGAGTLPPRGLRLSPGRARAAASFNYFALAYPTRQPSISWPRLTARGWDHDAALARTARRTTVSISVRFARHWHSLCHIYERGWRHAPFRDHSSRSADEEHGRCPAVPAWSLQSPH